ncbi:PrsW family glutamic-type intramembrane protease [Nostoc sp. FACHB-110]|uniref:PrsW family intramembrane metalloprotease n=1 Tax=Nostoc sp. FACHB-110 TaxID=2692834 RepID=UPI0016846235|nr:PrsW family glutamic-type intramembrane protease [Nostoc sp. FACHB-110]MBD2436944.1 PrsW family intramembrane metalloprotease [Nostoc sp. FACHB-110]
MSNLALLLWAVIPPLLFLGYYYRRVAFAPFYLRLLWFFVFGAISGVIALNLELGFETLVHSFVGWQHQRSLVGVTLRQLVEIGPIEEGCKLAAVVLPTIYLQRKYQLRPSTVFLFTIAVALGFTAEENWIYFYRGTASFIDRTIGTPVHAMFSAPWGYALGFYFSKNRNIPTPRPISIAKTFLNAIVCHALVNVLSIAWRYPEPLKLLSYSLFPFLLWMFWRLEQLLRKVQGQPPINLISARTPQHRYWQTGLVIFALMLGGNSIFGWFLLARVVSPLRVSQLLYPNVLQFIASRFLLNLMFALVAWGIYLYLINLPYR